MILRDHKTTSWESDIQLAEKITDELRGVIKNPKEFVSIIRKYASEKIETYTDPARPELDGYGSREIWLSTFQAELELEEKWIAEHRMVKVREVLFTSGLVVLKESCQYVSENILYEKERLIGMPVYNGKIAGAFIHKDPEPTEFAEIRDRVCKDILANMDDVELDKSGLYIDYKVKRSCSWEEDAKAAKKIADRMMNLYLSPEENYKFMHTSVAENMMTITSPVHYEPREGYGSREIWLACELYTRRQNVQNQGSTQILKHVNVRGIGAAIVIEEDRTYVNPDGTLYYMKGVGTGTVVNGKMAFVQMYIPCYPEHVLKQKCALYTEAIASLGDSVRPWDKTLCPYLIQD